MSTSHMFLYQVSFVTEFLHYIILFNIIMPEDNEARPEIKGQQRQIRFEL